MPPHLRRVAQNLQRTPGAARQCVSRSNRRDDAAARAARRLSRSRRAAPAGQKASGDRVTLATGHGAVIGRESGVHDADWLIALDVTSGRVSATTEAIVRLASRIEPEWLAPTRSEVRVELNATAARSRPSRSIGTTPSRCASIRSAPAMTIARGCSPTPGSTRDPDPRSRRCCGDCDSPARRSICARVDRGRRAARHDGSRTSCSPRISCHGRRARALRQSAPDGLTVPSGRDMTIEYAEDGSVGRGGEAAGIVRTGGNAADRSARTPITFHLLAPNGRPVQTTQDLKSFWERTYPEVRKELRGRYPRHPWPEDPWTATPTHRAKRRT